MAKRKQKSKLGHIGAAEVDLSHYEKATTAAGNSSRDCGDETARKLRGVALPELYKLAATKLGESERALRKRYSHLNSGMQRMNLGNRIRGAQQ